jgi:hypothetical protein
VKLLRPPPVETYERMNQTLRRLTAQLALDRAEQLEAEARQRAAAKRARDTRLRVGLNDAAQMLLDMLAPEAPAITAARRQILADAQAEQTKARRAA